MSGADKWMERGHGRLPGLLGVEILSVETGTVHAQLAIRDELLAPNGFLHAATVIALADTAAGYGTWHALPTGASGFTTIELKSNFLATTRAGLISCVATMAHGGRTTQVWDATVKAANAGATIALFRCTQLILYAPAG